MHHPHKTKAPALVRGGFVKTVSSALTDSRHSTRANSGRKSDVNVACPVCNSRRYLGKHLSLFLGAGMVSAAVCDACHAAASLSAGFGFSVAHRLYQLQQYAGGHHV